LCQHQFDRFSPEFRRVCLQFHFSSPFDKFIKRECPKMSGYLKQASAVALRLAQII